MAETAKTAEKSVEKSVKTPVAKKATTKPTAAKIDPLLKQLLESGAHFGHRTARWNPKMNQYIFTSRGGVHIIDLNKTLVQLQAAEKAAYELTKAGGQILFVGTKRQAKPILERLATDSGMPYVTHRWLGGMLTNLDTINLRIKRLKTLETQKEENDFEGIIKKEKLLLEEQMAKLNRTFNGVRDMHGVPAAIFVVDMPKEHIAILEANKLGLPVIAMADTNADPELVTYPIASNDDAIKSIETIAGVIAAACKKGSTEYRAKADSEMIANEEGDK